MAAMTQITGFLPDESRLTLRAGLPDSFAPEDSKEMLFSADPREED